MHLERAESEPDELGREIARFGDRRWFPVKPAALERARRSYARWGRWTLLLSWVPVIGDPLTLVAGMMRERFSVFLALVAFAKTLRYVLLAVAVTLGLGATILSRAGTRREARADRPKTPADLSWQTPTPVTGVVAARRPVAASRDAR